MAHTTSSKKESNFSSFLFKIGLTVFIIGTTLFLLIFYPVLWQEAKYSVLPKKESIKPIDEEFGIVIPKIRANAKIIDNVDPYNPKEYQWALTKGVAHAKNTAYPGSAGNSFIFAHSSVDWYIANRYNSVFYLLHKLEKGDKIEVYYQKNKYTYKVVEKKLVEPSEVSYLSPNYSLLTNSSSLLTLMTCWPPGTNIKRLIIVSQIVVDK